LTSRDLPLAPIRVGRIKKQDLRLPKDSKGLSGGCTGLGLGLLTKLPLHCAMQKIRAQVMFARLPMIAVLVEPRDCTRLRSGVPGNDMSRITAGGQGKASCELRITERPQRGAKDLPNLVKITSRDWLA
jgi:hypothetical protein